MAEPRATLENRRSAPHSRRAFHRVRELIATADVPNDARRMRELPAGKGEPGELRHFIEATDTDGLLVLLRDRLAGA